MTLKEQLMAIQETAQKQNKSKEFCALAILFWLEWDLNLSLSGNGFMDDDETTQKDLNDKKQIKELQKFIKDAGIVSWYNK